MPLIFPTHLFNPRGVKVWLANSTVQSGQSLSGVIDVIRTDGGGLRMVEFSGIVLRTNDAIRAWEAWQAELQAGASIATVPVFLNRYNPRPLQGSKPTRYGTLANQSDDPYFPEAAEYGAEMIKVNADAPAPFRSVQISVTMSQGSAIKGGETFSIAHPTAGNHIYKVNRVLSRAGDNYTIKLDCPLREALAGNEKLSFDVPKFDAHLMPDTDIALMLENYRSETSITFREAL